MIWNDDALIDENKQVFVRAVTENLTTELCLPPADITAVEEVISSLVHFCSNRFLSLQIPDELLAFLLARGLWSAGEQELAHRVAHHSCRPHISKMCSVSRLTATHAVLLWRLFQAGALKRSFWISYDAELWVLDLAQIDVEQHTRLEVYSTQGMKAMLDSVFMVWDSSSKATALHIKGIEHYAGAFLGLPSNAPAVNRLVDELKTYTQAVAKHVAQKADWPCEPSICFA